MVQFHLFGFIKSREWLDLITWKSNNTNEPLEDFENGLSISALRTLSLHCKQIGLIAAVTKISKTVLRAQYRSLTGHELRDSAKEITDRINEGLADLVFMYIPAEKAKYHSGVGDLLMEWEKPDPFPQNVRAAFPSAVMDMDGACDSYACGLNTGCVFYLMRVAEHGLRALARDRSCSFPLEIELVEWVNLIDQIEKKVKEIDNWPRSKAKTEALSFYRGATQECRAFKDVWRNHVMHSRDSYDEKRASSVMSHVSTFMQGLAVKHLSEKRKQPLVWK